jgi:hypothetical protein
MLCLSAASQLAGWVTPSSRDWKDSPGMSLTATNADGSERTRLDQLPRQTIGATPCHGPASTEKSGVLAAEFARWLMGFPPVWDCCGAMAMRLCPPSQRPLFEQLDSDQADEN